MELSGRGGSQGEGSARGVLVTMSSLATFLFNLVAI